MNDVTATTEATPAKAKAPAKKAAAKKAAADRAAKVSVAGAKDKAAKAKAQVKKDRAISAGRKVSDGPKDKSVLGHALTAKIKFGTGADGKKLSVENCPKRAGTNAAKQWKKYGKATMTIQGAIDAVGRGWILHDLRQGYIEVVK